MRRPVVIGTCLAVLALGVGAAPSSAFTIRNVRLYENDWHYVIFRVTVCHPKAITVQLHADFVAHNAAPRYRRVIGFTSSPRTRRAGCHAHRIAQPAVRGCPPSFGGNCLFRGVYYDAQLIVTNRRTGERKRSGIFSIETAS